jgi:hypothetical protein
MSFPRMLAVCFVLLPLCRTSFAAPERLPESRRIPVLAWMGVPEKEASEARYRELAECGFTIDFTPSSSTDAILKALEAAKAAGVRLLVHSPELDSDPVGTVNRLKGHPALAGYFLADEPDTTAFPKLATWADKIRSADRGHIIYINLLPNYATTDQLRATSYAQYVDRFAKAVPSTFLSFDFYPIVGKSVRPSWYENLEVVSAAARKADKPFWAFALSLRHYGYPVATIENLREEVYSDLAYGAQGIQYFTYWQPTSFDCGDSPIDANGKRTAVYDVVKRINAEIRAISPVFAGAKAVSIGHTGEHIPAGTRPFEAAAPVKSVRTQGDGAIVSRLANGPRQYLVIVNRDIEHPMPTTLTFDGSIPIDRVDKEGQLHPVDGATANVNVEPGDAMIFSWKPLQ